MVDIYLHNVFSVRDMDSMSLIGGIWGIGETELAGSLFNPEHAFRDVRRFAVAWGLAMASCSHI
jgi:hypothetical protein